jgi:predicted helicase
MAPYAIAHLKLGLFLEETGYKFDSGKRLGIYLTNTLEAAALKSEALFEEFIAEEANQATKVKRDASIMVVVGNPPYSANSINTNDWIVDSVRNNYYPKDEIKEQNPKLLLDDYVKFFRFSQSRIDKTSYGILAFITNHGYLDNPTFREMRQSLMQSFDKIYTLDLHGNSNKKEICPDGSPDENVFDIQQGVSTGFFIKQKLEKENSKAIYHSEIWGQKHAKYDWLLKNDVNSTIWFNIEPKLPFSFFIAQNADLLSEYETGWKITDLMPIYSTGVKTHRDHFVLSFDLETLKQRLIDFRNLSFPDDYIKLKYKILDTSSFNLARSRKDLAQKNDWERYFTKCLYRPFDFRFYFHSDELVDRPRNEVMKHIAFNQNIGLITTRQTKDKWDVLVTEFPCVHKACAAYDTNSVFPLYLQPNTQINKQTILELGGDAHHNFTKETLNEFQAKLGYIPTVKSIFYYIYAVFYSPTYRTRYAEFLKIDFPRVPLTCNDALFCQLAIYGEELVTFHLMKSSKLDNLITQFEDQSGDCKVDTGHPKYTNGKVTINKKGDGFTGVPEDVWNFYVGGYQVCQKWLKDRKGRTLSAEDVLHYQKIVVALQETIWLMQKIDEAIPSWPIT